MIRTVQSRVLPHPIEDVFDFIADFSRTPEWDPGVCDSRRLDVGPIAAGSRFHVVTLILGRRIPMDYRIRVYEPPLTLVLEGVGLQSTARDDIRLQSVGPGSTRITWALDVSFKGPTRILEPLSGPLIRRLGRKALNGLVARATMPLRRPQQIRERSPGPTP